MLRGGEEVLGEKEVAYGYEQGRILKTLKKIEIRRATELRGLMHRFLKMEKGHCKIIDKGEGRGKKGKHGKVGMKRNWWVLAQPLYSPQ